MSAARPSRGRDRARCGNSAPISASLALREGVKTRRSSSAAKALHRRLPPPRSRRAAAPARLMPLRLRPDGPAPPRGHASPTPRRAPISAMVAVSSSQSAWSEITSGSSTPRCLARCSTRIQPEATATTGSGRRRVQRSLIAEGGASTICARQLVLGRAGGIGAQIAERHAVRPHRVAQRLAARRAG